MATRYHVTKTGQARPCTAERKCPYGDLQLDHYNNKEDAAKAYETKMAAKTLSAKVTKSSVRPFEEVDKEFFEKDNAVSKLNKEIIGLTTGIKDLASIGVNISHDDVEQMAEYGKNIADKRDEVTILKLAMEELEEERLNASASRIGDGFAKLLNTDEKKLAFAKEMMGEANAKMGEARSRMLAAQYNSNEYFAAIKDMEFWDARRAPYFKAVGELQKKARIEKQVAFNNSIRDHSDKSIVPGVIANGSADNNSYKNFYSRNAGNLNPTSLEGTGAQYAENGDSYVICGNNQGGEARVIKSSGEFFEKGMPPLGQAIVQVKQGQDRDVEKHGLRVIGYVDSRGNSHGYVPNSKVSFFVFK